MTKVKEKMVKWSRYSKENRIIATIASIVCLLVMVPIFILNLRNQEFPFIPVIGQILMGISIGIMIICDIIESFKDKSTKFVQKNSFWNIVLSNKEVITSLILAVLLVFSIFHNYCRVVSILDIILDILLVIIMIIGMFKAKKISGFFENRLKE